MKRSLLETNPYLKDPSKRAEALARNIESSSAIEGIRIKRDPATGRFLSMTKGITAQSKSAKTSR